MRILFVSANHRWKARIALADELRGMRQSLRDCDAQITLLPAAQLEDLESEFRRNKFDTIHFSGHVDSDQGLLFQKPNGENDVVPISELPALLKKHDVKFAVVNGCNTVEADGEIEDAADAGTGNGRSTGNSAAMLFVKVLYDDLAAGSSLQKAHGRALDAARKAVDASRSDADCLPGLTLAESADQNLSFNRKPADEGDVELHNKDRFDRLFYVNYLDEQVNVLKRNIKLNQYALRALVALGIGMLLFSWGESIAGRVNADFSFPGDTSRTFGLIVDILVTTGKDILAFLGMAFESVVGKAADADAETPLLDWMMKIGEITPLAIASLQHRWCVHGKETLQEMNALRELVKNAEEMSPTLQTRLDKILDQSVRTADLAWKNLREYLPPRIAPVVDDILDKNFGEDLT